MFTDSDLLDHLEIAHEMQYDDIESARNAAKLASDRTVRWQHVRGCHDCSYCRTSAQVQNRANGEEGAKSSSIR